MQLSEARPGVALSGSGRISTLYLSGDGIHQLAAFCCMSETLCLKRPSTLLTLVCQSAMVFRITIFSNSPFMWSPSWFIIVKSFWFWCRDCFLISKLISGSLETEEFVILYQFWLVKSPGFWSEVEMSRLIINLKNYHSDTWILPLLYEWYIDTLTSYLITTNT